MKNLCAAAAVLITATLIAATLTVRVASAGESPTAPGPLQVAVAEYNLGDTAFRRDGFTAEIAGVVHYPVEKGVRPLIVMQHGLFETCADPVAGPAFAAARLALFGPSREQDPAERERLGKVMADAEPKLSGWPCAPGVDPVRSYRGYDYLGRQLASHGFVVVSIGVNGINAGGGDDFPARAALLNRHLELWQRGELKIVDSDGAPVDLHGRVDVTNVGTLGHSRGGRAVMNHAAHPETWPAGVRIKAVVPVEPVDRKSVV